MVSYSPYIKDQIKSTNRFTALDGLRGVAVLAVVIYHFGSPYNTFFPSGAPSPYSFSLGELGVQLFFVISGFVILLSAVNGGNAKNFIISRVSRLYPAYWVSVLFSSLLIATIGIETRSITLNQVIINLTMLQRFFMVENVDQVYWTLAVEIQFYLLIIFCLVISRGKLRADYLLSFGILWSLAGTALMVMFPGDSSTGLAKLVVWGILAQHAPFFCFGMAMFLYFNTRHYLMYASIFAGLAVVNTYLAHSIQYSVVVLLILSIVFVVVHRGRFAVLDSGLFQAIGKISYSLYLMHTIAGLMVIHYLTPYMGVWGSRVVAFAVVIFLAVILHHLCENKASAWMKRQLKTIGSR